jgi:hypothetical protein
MASASARAIALQRRVMIVPPQADRTTTSASATAVASHGTGSRYNK